MDAGYSHKKMIPRFKPYLGKEELLAAITPDNSAVQKFEAEFARTFEAKYALAFPYGRSALWALFNAMGIHDGEIIMPAYTCVVVAHAIVLSGNRPRFVDISLHDYNMDLKHVAEAITNKTRAIIATHLFGYPLDIDRLAEIVREAELRIGHKIWVIQDCAHSFGAEWKGKKVCNAGDAAIFGLNISKMITSIFGGILTTNDRPLSNRLRIWRDEHLYAPGTMKTFRRQLYLLAAYVYFYERLYRVGNFIEEKTSLLDTLSKAYHLDQKIHFPPDYNEQMTAVEARVGIAQLKKYNHIVLQRRKNANYYFHELNGISKLELAPLIDGATYSHFTIRVPNKTLILKSFLRKGIELGQLIQYSLPHMNMYSRYVSDKSKYPNSLRCSESAVNLPIHQKLPSSSLVELTRLVALKN
jgi:dTDP-4-amino-4,6-dideoxygalactose transaminase